MDSSSAKRRECIVNAIRERWQFSIDITMVLRENRDAFEYWNNPSIVALTGQIHSKQRLSRIGGRLLVWLDQILKDDPRRLNSSCLALRERRSSKQHVAHDKLGTKRGDGGRAVLVSNSRSVPPTTAIIAPSGSSANSSFSSICGLDEAQHFNLFHLLATFSALIRSRNRKRQGLFAGNMLSILGLLREEWPSFNLAFVESYWSRVSVRVVAVGVSQYRPRDEEWADALIVYAATLLSENIRNCEICKICSHQEGTPSVTQEVRPLSFNDPILGQRASRSSSLHSHLSAIKANRGSSASGEKRTSKASSAGMSIDFDLSGTWRLSAHFHVSEHGFSRAASMMSIDE